VWDHQRLDGQLAELARLVQRGDLPRAVRVFGHYERGVERHVREEEGVLLSTVASERTGSARVTPAVIASAHAEILGAVKQMGQTLAAEDVGGFRAAHDRVVELMRAHAEKEEQALYPIDALLGAAEAERIVARLRSH
jgi:hypothetical protein